MRMAELSDRSGVAAPTIRYYIREGLVPAGEATARNQAVYDEGHVGALRLARALVELGGLSIVQARTVIDHLAAPDADRVTGLGKVQYALTPSPGTPPEAARERVGELLARLGWQVRPDNPAATSLAQAIGDLGEIGVVVDDELLEAYAAAARTAAETDVARLAEREAGSAAVSVVALDVLGDRAISALRRLAQEDRLTHASDD